ncbi:unnamed protein product, partial [Ectocarpus sp. 12 AP-2014]
MSPGDLVGQNCRERRGSPPPATRHDSQVRSDRRGEKSKGVEHARTSICICPMTVPQHHGRGDQRRRKGEKRRKVSTPLSLRLYPSSVDSWSKMPFNNCAVLQGAGLRNTSVTLMLYWDH